MTSSHADSGRAGFMAWLDDSDSLEAAREAALLVNLREAVLHQGGIIAALEFLESSPAPQFLLVDVDRCGDVMEAMNRLADACEPGTRVIAIGSVNDVQIYRQLLDLGVTEYLVKPASAEAIARALHRTRAAEPAHHEKQAKSCTTLAVIGTRGGCGATSVAVSVAWAFAEQHKVQTMLLDLDLQLGSAAMSLDLEPSRGLREILSNPDRIDSLLVRSAVTRAGDRLGLLSAEEPLDAPLDLHGEALKSLLKSVEEDHDVVVMDVSRRLDALAKAALEVSDTVCVVTDLSLPGMRDTKRLLKLLAERRPQGRIVLAANRVDGVAGEIPLDEFERAVQAKMDFVLPFDAKAAADAADQGKSLAAMAEPGRLSAELARLAGSLIAAETAPDQPPARSWLRRLVGA